MAGRLSTAASSAPGTRISIVSALPDAVKSPGAIIRILAVPGTQQFAFKLRPSHNKRGTRFRMPSQTLRFPKTKRPTYCQSRLVLRRRGLLAFASVPARFRIRPLHLREGWIRGEERRGGRLPDVGQLVGRRPKARIGVRFLQQQVQGSRVQALRGNRQSRIDFQSLPREWFASLSGHPTG